MRSRYERRQLRKIEHALEVTDPGLAAVLRGGAPPRRRVNSGPVRLVIATVGVVCVLIGTTSTALPLIFPGFLVLMVAGCMHTTSKALRSSSAGYRETA
jgi:hypothetical protein